MDDISKNISSVSQEEVSVLEKTGNIRRIVLAVILVVVVLSILGLALYVNFFVQNPSTETTTATPSQLSNPIQNKIPESLSPTVNPIGDAYTNPF